MGGRQYMNLSIAYYLPFYASWINTVLYTQEPTLLPDTLATRTCGDLLEAFRIAQNDGVTYFICDVTLDEQRMNDIITNAQANELKIVVRLGLIPSARILTLLSTSAVVRAVICVEHQVFEMVRDHPVAKKCAIITNGFATCAYKELPPPMCNRNNAVVYLGSLVPQKGFGRLASVWPDIRSRVPGAHLHVIGSGQLYSRDRDLGKFGIASESFEAKWIRPFLCKEDGDIDESVTFHGALGEEKADILRTARVGIANPVGHTETFCISAVEIQASGTPVIAGARDGLFDTVRHRETGYLVKSGHELRDRVVELLKNPEKGTAMGTAGRQYVFGKYNFHRICQDWENLFIRLDAGYGPFSPEPKPHAVSGGALVVKYNAKLKRLFKIEERWPCYLGIVGRIASVRKKWRGFIRGKR